MSVEKYENAGTKKLLEISLRLMRHILSFLILDIISYHCLSLLWLVIGAEMNWWKPLNVRYLVLKGLGKIINCPVVKRLSSSIYNQMFLQTACYS